MLSMARARFDLSDDDFEVFLNHAKEALASDRNFQSKQKMELCAHKSKLTDLITLGLALNETSAELEANQESLGRRAAAELGPALFLRIQSQIANEARREITVADFPVLLVAQNRDLETEIQKICSEKKQL